MKKIKLLIMCLFCVIVMTNACVIPVMAATSKTSTEALAWVSSKTGIKVGSGQCVALIAAYYNYMGFNSVGGNGCDYATNSIPAGLGWREKGGIPKPGDILIYTGSTYGHVAIHQTDTVSWHQNWSGLYVEKVTRNYKNSYTYKGETNNYWGCIHIDFADNTVTQVPAIPTIQSASVSGTNISVTWNSVAQSEKYTVDFWNANSDVHNYFTTTSTSMTQSFSSGLYGVRVCAENSLGPSGFSYFTYVTIYDKVPEVPEVPQVTVSGESANVTWNSVERAEKYVVDFWDADTYVHNYFTTTTTSYSQILDEGRYGVRVCAENSLGPSGFSFFKYIYIGKMPVTFDANGGKISTEAKASHTYNSINGIRGVDELVVFNNSGETTGTNIYGTEVLVNSENIVTEVISRIGNAKVPENGFILSGNREAQYWLDENVSVGDYVIYKDNNVFIYDENEYLFLNKKVEFGSIYGKLPIPTREGYIFCGWQSSAECGEKIFETSEVFDTIAPTLYACWKSENTYIEKCIKNNEGQYEVEVNLCGVNTSENIYFACFKEGKLINFERRLYGGNTEVFLVNKDIDEVRIFAWEDGSLNAICDKINIKENEFNQ